MDRSRKTSLVLVIILLVTFASTQLYYSYTIGSKDSQIASLTSQISNQTKVIENLNGQIMKLKDEVANLTNQIANMTTVEAEITFIGEDSNFYPMAGTAVAIPFDIHITNMGSTDIHNATLALENIGNNIVPTGTYTETMTISTIQAKQTFETSANNHISFWILLDLTRVEEARGLDYLVTLSWNGTLLDQKTYYHGT